MLDSDKQIEEMAKDIFEHCSAGLFEDEAREIARFVIERRGYRKASEVAREIFNWFDENAVNLNFVTGNFEVNFGRYLELKKQYTESSL